MENNGLVPFKVQLIQNDSEEPEIRRFVMAEHLISFGNFFSKIMEIFPCLNGKSIKIYWIDEDGDEVTISSEEEFLIAATSIQSGGKKFYVKEKSSSHGSAELGNSILHPDIYCDGCECNIVGFRYKCVACRDYDLCKACEEAGIHAGHPMLKIPHPLCFDRMKLRKLTHILESVLPFSVEVKHHRRRHSHDGGHPDASKRKKRSEKRESGPDTGDESEEGCRKKHSHRKFKKQSKCQYSQLMNEVLNYFNPINFQTKECREPEERAQKNEEFTPAQHLKSVGATLQKLLEPLGVNVELEVQPKVETDKKSEEKTKEKRNEEPEPAPKPSAPPLTENAASPSEQIAESMKQKIEEITKILASQSVSNKSSAEDGWVSFEELKKDSEEPQPSSSGESIPKPKEKTQANSPQMEKTSSPSQGSLYPDLGDKSIPEDAHLKEALDKMLEMGFTNEGAWLTALIKAKNGNIEEALNTLLLTKKN